MPDTFSLPFWIYFLPSPCLWPLWDGLGTTSTGPCTLSSCWDQQMGSPGRRWMEGNRMRSVNIFPWLPPLKLSQTQSQFFKVSSPAKLCLSSTDAPFYIFGSRLIRTYLISPISHNLITFLKYFHYCILFV